MNTTTLTSKLHIIWAIAAKDIGDGLRNKTTLSIIIGVAFIVLSAQALPLLLKLSDVQQVAIYAAGDSAIFANLQQGESLRIVKMRSEERLQAFVRQSSTANAIGLMLPADFDAQIAAGNPITVSGYKLHWYVNKGEVATAVATLLTQISGVPVQVNVQPLYPQMDSGGRPSLIVMSLVVGIISISGILIPHLLIEEKEAHTLEALLVSPATTTQMILGKALAGLVYGLATGLVILALNGSLVMHWGVALFVILLGALFAVALGLLFGSLFNDVSNMNLWMGLLFTVALLPAIMGSFSSSGAAWLRLLLSGLPTHALERGSRLAFVETVDGGALLRVTAVLLAWAAVLYGAVVGVLKRNGR